LTTVEFALHQQQSDHEEDCVQCDHSDVFLSVAVIKEHQHAAFSSLTYSLYHQYACNPSVSNHIKNIMLTLSLTAVV